MKRPYETAVQNDHIETDPLASMPRGLVLFAGSERHLLSHPDSPPPRAVLEIRLRGSGLLIHGPSLWAVQPMGATSLASRWEPSVLPENVLNTISQARVPSTWRLYALKWSVFSTWCTTRGADPEVCDISLILSFLQELSEKGRSPSTLKVYVAAIAASHAPIDGQSVGRNN